MPNHRGSSEGFEGPARSIRPTALRKLVSESALPRVLGAPALADLNEIADAACEVAKLAFGPETPPITAFLDPVIEPVRAERSVLVMLVACLLRQVGSAPAAEGFAPAIDLVTGQAGGWVCLEMNRVGVDVRGAGWPAASLCRLLSRRCGARLRLRLEREEMLAALRIPAAPREVPPGRVWVLDDEPVVRQVVGQVLRSAGHEVLAAGGLAGIEDRLRLSPPSLLLVEATLADPHHGLLLQYLAEHYPHLVERVVVMTTNPGERLARRALAGLRRGWYLSKPFTSETLLACVRRRLACLGGGEQEG